MDSRTLDINRSTDQVGKYHVRRFISGFTAQSAGWLILVILSSSLLLTNLNYPLFEPDETRNAQLAINVLVSGNWISLTLNGEPYWNKPPALIWAIAACYQQFGIAPWSTRLPGAIAAVLTILLTFGLGQKIVGVRSAFIGAIALLLCCGFVAIGRWVVMDSVFSCCATTMAFALLLADQKLRLRKPTIEASNFRSTMAQHFWLVVAGMAGGLGVLLKGPVILILVVPPIVVAYALGGQLRFFWHRRILSFLVAFIAVAAPWYLIMALTDPDFFSHFIWHHHVVRFTSAFDHEAPWWFYLPMIFVMMFPASYLLPSLVKYLIVNARSDLRLQSPAISYLAIASLWPILFFSFSESKLPTYILPSLPFFCLLVGMMLNAKAFAKRTVAIEHSGEPVSADVNGYTRPKREFWSFIPYISPLGFVAMSVIVVLGTRWFAKAEISVPLIWFVLAGISLLIVALVPWVRNCRPEFAWSSVAVTGLGLMMTLSHILVPNIAAMRSTHEAIAILKQESPKAPIVFFDRHPYAAEMTLPKNDVHYFKFDDILAFRDFVARHPDSIVIASEKKLSWLDRTLRNQVIFKKSGLGEYIHVGIPQLETESGVRLARGVEK